MPREPEPESPALEDTLAVPPRIGPDAAPEPSAEGWVGPYRLLEVIGEGGMGEVWLAEQLEPRRMVALKLIKAGMDTSRWWPASTPSARRWPSWTTPPSPRSSTAEARPRAGPTSSWSTCRAFRFTEHCDIHRLSTAARLELFIEVCEGVQHAHQKAIIHRDLKPSNILVSVVDGRALVKIIDFGIAKATGSRLTEKTLFTVVGAIIGTPAYMSPEQADASDRTSIPGPTSTRWASSSISS